TPDSLTKIVPRLPRRLEGRQVFHTVWMLPNLGVPSRVPKIRDVRPILVQDAAGLWQRSQFIVRSPDGIGSRTDLHHFAVAGTGELHFAFGHFKARGIGIGVSG